MHTEEHYRIEDRGVKEGINPRFGHWFQTFKIEPISFQNKGNLKKEFSKKVQSMIEPNYVFYGDVRVTITLYLNEQKVDENPQYGDLDNYAKLILDSIKGVNGVLIDDCQAHSFSISWIDTPGDSYFEISVDGRPDDFIQKPLKLYEMPDKKFYPVSAYSWTQEGLIKSSPEAISRLLSHLKVMIMTVKKTKHEFRQGGMKSIEAYRNTKFGMPCLLGFHRSAVENSGFELVKISDWEKKPSNFLAKSYAKLQEKIIVRYVISHIPKP